MTEVKSGISRKNTFSSKVKKLFGSSASKATTPIQTKTQKPQDPNTTVKTTTKVQNIYNNKAVGARSNEACNKSINSNSPTNSRSSEYSLSKKMDRSSKSSSKASSTRSSLEKDLIGGQPKASASTSSNLLTPLKSPPVSTMSAANSHATADRTLPHLITEQAKRECSPPAPTASSTASLASATTHQNCKRFVVLENGRHEHHLKAAKRQEKLTSMLKNIMGSQKTRDEAVSAVPDLISLSSIPATPISTIPADGTTPAGAQRVMDPPTLMSGWVRRLESKDDISFNDSKRLSPKDSANELNVQLSNSTVATAPTPKTKACEKFAEKYGKCMEVAGRGAFGTVRICHKKSANKQEGEQLYAVKEFIKKKGESAQKYEKRLTAEFCISSSLHHTNIVGTIDLLKDAKGDYLQVMEYCPGGDLFSLIIAAGKLEYLEADCFFKQLLKGVVYMHDMGVCHRDLKPENLLLTADGKIKITDFGSSECFKMAWERDIHLSGGICGSSPYIAPEEYSQEEFDPRAIDIWACGVIYMAMRTGRQLWSIAVKEDQFYYKYLRGRKEKGGYKPIEMMKRARCRNVIYSMLDPSPSRRITGKQILNSEWGREIKCCHETRAIKV